MHDKQSRKGYIRVESKLPKKTCPLMQHEFEPLSLIHYDIADLKQTMSRGGKNYFSTFIDDFSRYTKVYLIRHTNEAFNMF